jgi:hypothetical protein
VLGSDASTSDARLDKSLSSDDVMT